MGDQNYSNHTRTIPLWHRIIPVILLALLGGSINNLISAVPDNRYSAALLLVVVIVLGFFYWYIRAFALRAQDRAIRAEETFRHFILTGKPLDSKLRMRQIIALRFASDAEFPALAQQTVAENLSSREIKQAIKNWKADYNRV
jgi:hypothetical protein